MLDRDEMVVVVVALLKSMISSPTNGSEELMIPLSLFASNYAIAHEVNATVLLSGTKSYYYLVQI